MATGGQNKAGYSLVKVGAFRLQDTSDYRDYRGIVACGDKIIVIDMNACQVQLHRLQDGKLLCTSHRLESKPRAICVINDMEIGVILDQGEIEIMAVESRDKMATIASTRNLQVQGGFDTYDGVVKFKENLVVCGVNLDTICWCVVSLNDGRVDAIHQVCKRSYYSNFNYDSHITIKDNIIYISCLAGLNSPGSGVYGFDILNPSQPKYTYKHEDLSMPGPIAINQDGFIYVCNFHFRPCIYQLTSQCQLVSIYRQGIPRDLTAIFWDHPHGHLYVTCWMSKEITIFKPEYTDPVISAEDKTKMDMEDGKEKGFRLEDDVANLTLEDYAAKQKGKQQQIGGAVFETTTDTQATGFNFGRTGSGAGFGTSVHRISLRDKSKFVIQKTSVPEKRDPDIKSKEGKNVSHLLSKLENSLKNKEKNAKFILWLGTDLVKESTMVFVCLYQGVMNKRKQSYKGINIYYKDSETPSRPIEPPHTMPIDSEFTLCHEYVKLLQQAIEKHGLALFKQHSNLEAITGSSFTLSKSKGCIASPSVVLYCQVKGIAPIGEYAFPTTLTVGHLSIKVDVREGYLRQGMLQSSEWSRTDFHKKLCIGISIGVERGGAGTLGPFVKINGRDKGFLTCAHVIQPEATDDSKLQLSVGHKVYQPADGESHPANEKSPDERHCGNVSKIVFNPDVCDPMNGLPKHVGVDAALMTVMGERDVDFRSFPFIPRQDLNNAGGWGRDYYCRDFLLPPDSDVL